MPVIGNNVPNEIKQNDVSMIETIRVNKIRHLKRIPLGYLNINSKRNKLSSIPCLIKYILDVFTIA